MKDPGLSRGLFPDVTILDAPYKATTTTIHGTDWIRGQRKILQNHNAQKNKNLDTVVEDITKAVNEYNADLAAKKARCPNRTTKDGTG